jgi:hypothetical protein
MKNSYKAYRGSSYCSQDNYPEEPVVIQLVREEQIPSQDGKARERLVLYFVGYNEGLILNMSHCFVLAEMSATDNPAGWVGLRIEIFKDPSVEYRGKRTGGLRIRPVPAPVPTATVPEMIQEEIAALMG